MKTVYVMVGIPASGKSTYAKSMTKSATFNNTRLSSDDIRKELDTKNNAKVFQEMNQRLKNLIHDEGSSKIYYDATNINRKRRRALFRNIKEWDSNVEVYIIFMSIPYSTAIERNLDRSMDSRVPNEVILRMHRQLQVPRVGVDCDRYEVKGIPIIDRNFSKLIEEPTTVEELVGHVDTRWAMEIKLSDTPHDCEPWHLESVFEHINMAIENANSSSLKTIALMHDLAKGITKVKDKSGYATYRSHAHVGAHYYMNFKELTKPILRFDGTEADILEVIHQHMNFHNKLGAKNIRNNKLTDEVIKLGYEFSLVDSKSKIKKESVENE